MFGKRKNTKELLVGLDVGSTAVRIVVGQIVATGEKPELQIVGAAEVVSEGVHRGVVTSIEDTVSSISACIDRAERMVGTPLQRAWIGISGSHILVEQSKGVVAVSKSNGEISEEDVERAVEAARAVATPLNYEILHVIPKNYTVDGQIGVKDPIGMTGVRLEVDTQMIQGLSAHIKNLTRAVYRTGLDINDVVLSILATAAAVTTERQKELGVAVVNIGGATTSVVVYEDGDILDTAVLSIGSEHITADLAIGLRTSIDVAERLKLQYGTSLVKEVAKDDRVDLSDLGAMEKELVDRRYIAEIISARAEEILERIDKVFKKVGKSGRLPAGVILTGGGSKLHGLVETSKDVLRLPVTVGYPLNITSSTDKVNDLAFTTAIGLVRWGALYKENDSHAFDGLMNRFKSVTKVKDWFKNLMP
ncbi:MAG: Cell division protein ftsA [Candidatus Magasanikbacteria bacterium GW2011_GWA2_45_39]|uniref:Cell division protein FtsA n=2 Tax=Candidatus Magasanikiibacteriota TaxID=1752731 RepID=A0A0G1Q931_9BACT|nr:MAG: Cell division protein ftsA [Candidatus Magasanikbacteria bacterium GW2011_GWA2_45_39]KKU14223.1 MAG: Cell division protein ftsA [Candidatus Magasanikbacteria bacterium GW2011_GWC2_45_8]HBW73750.1 cell division protein FtsA [Candidatus Magasanikbacteria bacterium]